MLKKYFAKLSIVDSRVWFFAFVIILFFLNYYSKTLFFRPCSIHQWRQADCLSITKNYYEEGMHFFEPKIHFSGVEGGKAVSECPILNYTVAALWKVFGEHEFIYRLLEYLIFILAVYVLFVTVLKQYASSSLAFFCAGFVLTSPLLVFYSLNFIADVPALSLGIICFCLFFKFYHNKEMKFFYASIFVGTLAVLMKASALMGLGILFFFSLIDLIGLNNFFKTEPLFKRKLGPIIALFLSLIFLFVWYRFALLYNNNNNNNIFLLTVLPIWELDRTEIIYNLKFLFNNHLPVFLNKAMLFLFFSLVLFVFSKFKQLETLLKYAFLFSLIYFVAYILFFFQVFNVHDYYLNNLMIFPIITLFCTCEILSQSNWINMNRSFATVFILSVTTINALHASAIYRLRMIEKDNLIEWFPWISEDDKKLADYLFWDYKNSIKRIENLTPLLRERGISRTEKVISAPDQSFDISLYFMDQKGYTIAKEHFLMDSLVLEKVMKNKASYLVLNDTTLKSTITFKRMAHRLSSFFISKNVEVFKIK